MESLPTYLHQDRGSSKKGLLKEKLELEPVRSKDGSKRVTIKRIEDELTFDKGFYVFIRALQLLKGHNEGVVLVGLAGPSGSGKTAFSERVSSFMPGISIISMDNYNDASKLVDSNFDDPRLTDYDLLLQNLADLRAGKAAQVPIYDYKVSSRVGYQTVPVPSSRVVIIEGIYALSERLRPLLDLRVSIAGGVHFDLIKRVLRDISRSGQGPEEIIQQVTETVYPMYKAFIEPDLQLAQLKIQNSFNPFTGFMNATYILKARRPADLVPNAVMDAVGGPCECSAQSEMVDIHLLPPGEDPETCQSWLRLRNREGRYTLMFEEYVTEGAFIISPRITFEVGVRVLGGLMSLGYTIGPILRRTTTSYQAAPRGSDGGPVVKLDLLEMLGQFVQVQGKSREQVQQVATALGLSDFIPHSYIEQVQLGQLTEEFLNQAVSQDVAKRFSVNGESLLYDGAIFGTSPSGNSAWEGMKGRSPLKRTTSGPTPAMSTSAPVSSSMPISIRSSTGGSGGSRTAGRPPSGGPAAGSQGTDPGEPPAAVEEVNGVGSSSNAGTPAGKSAASNSMRLAAGLLSQQLRQGSPGPGGSYTQEASPGPGSWAAAGGGVGGGNGGTTSANGEPRDSASSGSGMHRAGSRGELSMAAQRLQQAGGSGTSNGQSGGGGGVPLQVVKQLEVLGEAVKRYSGLQLQMEAMSHQYRQTNEQLAALTAATQALAQQLAAQQQQPRWQAQTPAGSLNVTAAMCAAGACVVAAFVCTAAAAALRRR